MDDLKAWIDKYVDKFNEPFPAYELAGLEEGSKIDLIKRAIEKNEPITFEYEDDVLY